ncbi:unnamed protein product [Penicillium camemberti]|uniref:Str. FM013 n=1 Tax=Penicillium camemberti (strain FM 013) TaxID=1429867 RepID=A0A0G4NXA2_PENC3|nr:unnamed protein product [Penicillium camemberti]
MSATNTQEPGDQLEEYHFTTMASRPLVPRQPAWA